MAAEPAAAGAEEQHGSKRNIILGYQRIEEIATSVAVMSEKLDGVKKAVDEAKDLHVDHEIRIRALELAGARSENTFSVAWWITNFILSAIMAAGAALAIKFT